jgi:hypothetical protein
MAYKDEQPMKPGDAVVGLATVPSPLTIGGHQRDQHNGNHPGVEAQPNVPSSKISRRSGVISPLLSQLEPAH